MEKTKRSKTSGLTGYSIFKGKYGVAATNKAAAEREVGKADANSALVFTPPKKSGLKYRGGRALRITPKMPRLK